MSCTSGLPMFRLLDRRVGWFDRRLDVNNGWVDINDPPSPATGGNPTSAPVAVVADNLTSWNDPNGIQLLPVGGQPGQGVVDNESLLAVLPPRGLARGCEPGAWLLLTPKGRVLRRDPCTGCWHPVWREENHDKGATDAHALAASRDRFAIVGNDWVEVWTARGEALVAAIRIQDAKRAAFFHQGDLLVASQPLQGPITLHRYSPAGVFLEKMELLTAIPGSIDRLAVDCSGEAGASDLCCNWAANTAANKIASDPSCQSGAAAPRVATTPVDAWIRYGQTARFTAAASGSPQPTTQWEQSSDSGATFVSLSDGDQVNGVTTGTLILADGTMAMSGNEYRAVFTNDRGTVTTPAATLTVNAPIWITTGDQAKMKSIWRGSWNMHSASVPFIPAIAADLADAFPPTNLIACTKSGFCLQMTGPDGVPATCWYSWEGCPIAAPNDPTPIVPLFVTSGSITSGWIDSGIPRCRWHRIRVDADVPNGTGIDISYVATDFDPAVTASWEEPSPSDWQSGPIGALDILMLSSTGRFVKIRLALSGDAQQTPVVWSVRIDFPRRTSLERLPAVYRATPEAEDFTERFLANFDASIEDLDGAIARFPALFDASAVPNEVLPWLGNFLDVAFDPEWPESRRREILATLPGLYAQRGTLNGFIAVFELIFGITPAVRELAGERPWGALADSKQDKAATTPAPPPAQLGAVRLFGKARARFHLGHSALGVAPLRGYGNPDLDPLLAEAYRFEVQIPRGSTNLDKTRMTELIESQQPAHTVANIRFGGDGFVVGIWSAVEIDTAFTPMPAPVLGASGNVRLRRGSVVAAGPPRGRLPLAVNVSSVVGVQTLLE